MTAVMAVEINNESAASLIQSVTVHNFQSAPLPSPSCGIDMWRMSGVEVAIFIAVA